MSTTITLDELTKAIRLLLDVDKLSDVDRLILMEFWNDVPRVIGMDADGTKEPASARTTDLIEIMLDPDIGYNFDLGDFHRSFAQGLDAVLMMQFMKCENGGKILVYGSGGIVSPRVPRFRCTCTQGWKRFLFWKEASWMNVAAIRKVRWF